MKRCIVTYAVGAHEEVLDISLPRYEDFAKRHGYDLILGKKLCDLPAAWNKVYVLWEAFNEYDQVVWFDSDLIIVDPREDFPKLRPYEAVHSLVRHFEGHSEIPNSGVWRLCKRSISLLKEMLELRVFMNHGWWEQAALMTLMGYVVPPEGSHFPDTRCRNVYQTEWYKQCQFMRVEWNSHPNYRAQNPRIVHCSYPDMSQRLEVMKALVQNPRFNYPRFDKLCPHCKKVEPTKRAEQEVED